MSVCLLALGANQGDPQLTIERALQGLRHLADSQVTAQSRCYRTMPVGGPAGQPAFLNAAAILQTPLRPTELLTATQAIERRLGRHPLPRWSARPIDIDLLLYEEPTEPAEREPLTTSVVCDLPELTLPHPRMSFRPFMLEPAAEIAPQWRHPTLQASLGELWQQLQHGDDAVVCYGGTAADRHWHAARLQERFAALSPFASITPPLTWNDYRTVSSWWWVGAGRSTEKSPREISPKLAIYLDGHQPLVPGIPTLRLPAGSRDEVLHESVAALQAVWPWLGSEAPSG